MNCVASKSKGKRNLEDNDYPEQDHNNNSRCQQTLKLGRKGQIAEPRQEEVHLSNIIN